LKRLLLTIFGLGVCAALFLYFRRAEPPETPAAVVRRATLVQRLTTNGKIEALDNFAVHVGVPCRVLRVEAQEGDAVRQGQSLATVENASARDALTRAQAQLEIARADQGLIERGGTAAELAEVDAAIGRARLEQQHAGKQLASLERLITRQAAPRIELEDQQQRLRKAEAELAAFEHKRKSLLGAEDRQRVLARIREAEAAAAQAAGALRLTEIRAPTSGVLYSLALKPGAFYQAGELVAQVGRLDKVRARLLVDEPELGRLQTGQPVRIGWDALPAASWHGVVERLPSKVTTVGARSVGEVLCTIDNTGQRLLPNVTVHVEIRTGVAENALVIPRAAVAREGDQTMILAVGPEGLVAQRAVRLGIQDPNRVQVLEGLAENEWVLLPGVRAISPGDKVRPKAVS